MATRRHRPRKQIDFARLGVPLLDKSVPSAALDYLTSRDHTEKSIRAANFRWLDRFEVMERFSASTRGKLRVPLALDSPPTAADVTELGDDGGCFFPNRAIVLPDPRDPTYGIARVDYHVLTFGTLTPPKYLNPAGRTQLYLSSQFQARKQTP
jgi:hypothetical protein